MREVVMEELVDEAVVGVELAADFVEEGQASPEALCDDFRGRVARLIEEGDAAMFRGKVGEVEHEIVPSFDLRR